MPTQLSIKNPVAQLESELDERSGPRSPKDRLTRFLAWVGRKWIRGRLMRLQTILALAFTLITIIPIAALTLWMDHSALQKERDAVQEKHLLLAKYVSADLSQYATQVTFAFRLAIRQAGRPEDTSGLASHLTAVGIRCVFRADQPRSKPNPQICPEADFDPGDITDLLEASKSRQLTFNPVRPDGRGRPTIFLVANDAGEVPAVAAISTDYFHQVQRTIVFGERGHAAIVDQNGQLLAHPQAALAAAMQNVATIEPVQRMMAGETGLAGFYSPVKQADMIAGFASIPPAGWGVMVVQPLAELQRRAASERSVALAIMFMGALVAALASWFFARYLTRSITPIMAAAQANATGQFGMETPVPGRFAPTDLRQLARSFNVMAREIRAAYRRQNEALEASRQAEADCRGIFDNATEGLYRTTPQGMLLRANPAMVQLCGYDTQEELLGAMAGIAGTCYVEPDRRAAFLQLMNEQGQVNNFISEIYRHRTGEKIWVSENARAVKDYNGNLLFFEGSIVDITERIRAEENMRRAIAAESANDTKSQFLATLSHELRTPLNAIIGFSEIMQRGTFGALGSERYLAYAGDIRESGLHLLNLINDLLDYAKIERDKYELHDEVIELSEFIPDVVRLIGPAAHKGEVEIKLDIEDRLPPLLADERATRQILLNLLSNAVKFTARDGLVTVQAHRQDGAISIHVKDNGIGIAPENFDKILTPFGQVEDHYTRKTRGTGLGLPIVKSLIELHGGGFKLDSMPGLGTRATVAFPSDRTVRTPNPN